MMKFQKKKKKKIFLKVKKVYLDQKIIFEKKIPEKFPKFFKKNFTTFFSNEQRVNLCGITQLKTAENQMSKPQLCTNIIFIAKKYL